MPQNPQTLTQKLFGIEGRIGRASYIGLSLLQMVAAFVLVITSMVVIQLSRDLAMALVVNTGVL